MKTTTSQTPCPDAVGTDSAGSIRTPSSYCGVYGLKPTAGLVPADGIFPLERTLDCAGPIARTLADLELTLDAIADVPPTSDSGVRVGVLEEGFGWPASEPDVDEAVRAALGAHGEPVSIPLHRNGIDIWVGIAMEGAYETMIRGHGGGTNTRAWSDPEMVRTLAGAPRLVASPSVTLMVLSGALASRAGSAHYAVARRLAGRLARAYDEAPRDTTAASFARIGVAIGKYWVNKRTPNAVFEALECHGGAGYVEESPLPRLYREAPLNSIWEGSGNVICLDVLRALTRDINSAEVVRAELLAAAALDDRIADCVAGIARLLEQPERLEPQARTLTESIALALQAGLMARYAPAADADAFIAARLGGESGLAYGTLPAGADCRAILLRAWPPLADVI